MSKGGMNLKKEPNKTLEPIIELIEGLVQEKGFKTLRFSESKHYLTTNYDCLVLRDASGKEYTISFDESTTKDPGTSWLSTNYIKD